eukprot:m.460875 g.460875  ORF g.460875 m.460875 type:complete len:182 (+) comp22160_c0_seq1:821-1366(+)
MDGVRITRALCLPFVTRTDTKTWVHSSDAPMASSIRIHRMAARIRIQDCWRVESVLNVMGWVASSPVNALQWAVRQAVLLLMIRSIQAIVRFRLEDMAVLRFKFIKIRPQTEMHNIIYAGVPSNFFMPGCHAILGEDHRGWNSCLVGLYVDIGGLLLLNLSSLSLGHLHDSSPYTRLHKAA